MVRGIKSDFHLTSNQNENVDLLQKQSMVTRQQGEVQVKICFD